MTDNTATNIFHATHVVSYRGKSLECTEDTYLAICEQLIAELGSPTPEDHPVVTPIDGATIPVSSVPEVDLVGRIRALSQEDLAKSNGFAPAPPIYTAGTRVVQTGVQNALTMQLTHDAKPSARTLAENLVARVLAEDRQDLDVVRVSDLRMSKNGEVVLASPTGEPGRGPRMPVSDRAFSSLMSRFPCRSGTGYLNDCPTHLRSINFNHWAVMLGELEANKTKGSDTEVVLRTRKVNGSRQAFAAVSSSYTSFDADKIGEALSRAFPDDARGSLAYDGQRMRLEGLWRTDVAPNEFVAGEFFKAGVIIRADDTGGGSIRVQSVLWRNLCLNLIILDKAVGVDIRIRHHGSVEALAERFREAFGKALTSVDGFRKAWGYAMNERDENLVQRVAGTTSDNITGLPVSAVLPGIFNGILDRGLVSVSGRKTDIVPKLLEMHSQDEAADAYGVSRASVINAFTRYAHQAESDPFAADLIREDAGKLLSGHNGGRPSPLPYLAL